MNQIKVNDKNIFLAEILLVHLYLEIWTILAYGFIVVAWTAGGTKKGLKSSHYYS